MTVNELNILEKKKQRRYILALSFFVLCILLSAGLYAYLLSVKNQITTLESSLQEVQVSISQRESDPLIQSYMLYEKNKALFSRLEYISAIPEHVSHLKLTLLRYWLSAQGFSYSDGNIQTQITSDNDTRGFWYEKVSNFVTWYRADPESPFSLSFINTFSWHDRIQHELRFELKEGTRPISLDDVTELPLDTTDNTSSADRSEAIEQALSADTIDSSWSGASAQ